MKLTLKHALTAIVLSSSFAAPVAVGQAEDATAAYLRGDYVTAHRLSHPLAEQGDVNAQSLLGAMYHDGLGVPQDYVRAHMWLNLAAAQGIQDAVENRNLVAERMTPAQIAEAQRLAREWRPTTQPPQ